MCAEEYKLEIFLPESHLKPVQAALQKTGAGRIGNYEGCMSCSPVTGCWRPLEGAQPHTGRVGEMCCAPERKLETVCRADRLEETLAAVRAVHPYEEPVIYVLPLCRPVTGKAVEVVAALLWQGDRFLICQRPAHKARGLLWEFVGGKVEPGETKEQALARECREELAVTVAVDDIFMEVTHAYPDLTVHLTLFHAKILQGELQKLEHNDLRWITVEEIDQYPFCPADEVILEKLRRTYGAETAR